MTINQDPTLWSLLPHTHVRGRRWEIRATYPDGRTEVVLAVPNYDFNWQTDYIFKEPLKVRKRAPSSAAPRVVRQLGREQGEPRSGRRRALGRADVKGNAVHGFYFHARLAAKPRGNGSLTSRARFRLVISSTNGTEDSRAGREQR